MRSFLKKAWSILAVAAFSASAIHADVVDGSYGVDGCCAPTPEPCYGYAYNPPTMVSDCCGWFACVEFLYLKPSQEGISYGSRVNAASLFSSVPVGHDFIGTLSLDHKYPKFEWDSGFRVGIGYRLPCDSWDIGLVYTHYRTDNDARNGTSFSDSSGINGTLFAPAYTVFFDTITPYDETSNKIDVEWRISFNQLDLDFAREFYVGRSVTIRPHTGLRALFIDQKYYILNSANGISPGSGTSTVSTLSESVRMDNDFKGVGLKAGLDMAFDIGCGLGIYGEATGALTFGTVRVTQRSDATVQTGAVTLTTNLPVQYHEKDSYDTLLPSADLALGLRWRQRVNCDQNAFTLKFGWEHHAFFGYNKYRSLGSPGVSGVVSNSPTGNLSFYGIVFSAALDF